MPAEANPFQIALLIILVIMIFNVIIFVHELGHFWAAKWRGLKIERFQIWFGKPIWKKTINGVQYGLGWIPAGGFVALPQMAPMEAIEGENKNGEPLPPVSSIDKIIVAFAGPLFSFLLALTAALIITVIGKPLETVPTTTIGWVAKDSPGQIAGLQRGDKILAINDEPIEMWHGPLDSVFMHIVTSRGKDIKFTIDRPGTGNLDITSSFKIPKTGMMQRRATRQVGIMPMSGPVEIGSISAKNAPIALAGISKGDRIISFNDTKIVYPTQVYELLEDNGDKPIEITYQPATKAGEAALKTVTVTPVQPLSPEFDPPRYMIGASFTSDGEFKEEWVYPSPIAQITSTLRQMWITIRSVASPSSDIGIQHLSGPIGIGKIQYYSLLMEYPFQRILGFMVLININLAILNLLPFPVLDGGHITIATMEMITCRQVKARFLEALQLGFVFLLFGVMIYVTSKDLFDNFGMRRGKSTEIVFPDPEKP